MHKGDTIPGLLTAVFGFAVAFYTLSEDTMKFRAQSSDGVPGAGFFPVLLGFVVGILGVALMVRGLTQRGSVQYFKLDEELKRNLRTHVPGCGWHGGVLRPVADHQAVHPLRPRAVLLSERPVWPQSQVQYHLYRGVYCIPVRRLCGGIKVQFNM